MVFLDRIEGFLQMTCYTHSCMLLLSPLTVAKHEDSIVFLQVFHIAVITPADHRCSLEALGVSLREYIHANMLLM